MRFASALTPAVNDCTATVRSARALCARAVGRDARRQRGEQRRLTGDDGRILARRPRRGMPRARLAAFSVLVGVDRRGRRDRGRQAGGARRSRASLLVRDRREQVVERRRLHERERAQRPDHGAHRRQVGGPAGGWGDDDPACDGGCLVRDLGERRDDAFGAQRARVGPGEQILHERRGRNPPRIRRQGGVEDERLSGSERMRDRDERLIAHGDAVDQHRPEPVDDGFGGRRGVDERRLRRRGRVAPNAARRATVALVVLAREVLPRPDASSAAASIGTYGVGSTSVVDRSAAVAQALERRRDRGLVLAEPLPGLGGLGTDHERQAEPRRVGEERSRSCRAGRRASAGRRPSGRRCRRGARSGRPTACHTNATESFFSIGCGVLVSTATSHVTNEPDATPVFTSCTFTGYTPGRLMRERRPDVGIRRART